MQRTRIGRESWQRLPKGSSVIRSSPQEGFLLAICRTSSRIFFGSAGRPRRRDFHRQSRRNPARCQRMNASGLRIAKASRQSNRRDSQTKATLVHGSGRRAFDFRSRHNASWRRWNGISARSRTRGENNSRSSRSNRGLYRRRRSSLSTLYGSANFCRAQAPLSHNRHRAKVGGVTTSLRTRVSAVTSLER